MAEVCECPHTHARTHTLTMIGDCSGLELTLHVVEILRIYEKYFSSEGEDEESENNTTGPSSVKVISGFGFPSAEKKTTEIFNN